MTVEDYGGFIFWFDEPERARLIKYHFENKSRFEDTLSTLDWSLDKQEILLVTFGQTHLSYAALVSRGAEVATMKYKIIFEAFVPLEPPVSVAEIEDDLGVSIDFRPSRASSGVGRRVESQSWQEIVNAIKRLRPHIASQLERLLEPDTNAHLNPDLTGIATMMEERDAANLSMRLAGFDYRSLEDVVIPATSTVPFLELMSSVPLREDQMIQHDSQIPFFGDLKYQGSTQSSAIVYRRGPEQLILMNVNRMPLEETLGTDLLYYSEKYDSFILVQYKRLRSESRRRWLYRIGSSDTSYQNELERMQACRELLQELTYTSPHTQHFRLHSDPFHFKLCRSYTIRPASFEMIDGIYVPLRYWEVLVDSPESRGRDGGIYIDEDNIGRNYSNSLFIELVRNGWLGTQGADSRFLRRVVEDVVSSGKSLTLGAHLVGRS